MFLHIYFSFVWFKELKAFYPSRLSYSEIFLTVLSFLHQQLKLVMDSIIWAFRHTERNIAETGLNLLLEMLKNFQVWCLFPLFLLWLCYIYLVPWCLTFISDCDSTLRFVINSSGRTSYKSSKKYLLFWLILFISLVSSCMCWCCSICFAW